MACRSDRQDKLASKVFLKHIPSYAKTVDLRDAKFHTLTRQGQTIHMHRSPIPYPKWWALKRNFLHS